MSLPDNILAKARRVKLVISDVDGVLTDGLIIIGSNGEEFKNFNVSDGVGVALAKLAGLELAFLSGRYSKATLARIREFGLDEFLWQGKLNKIDSYLEIKEKFHRDDAEIAYIGDDLIDLPVLNKVGFSVTVADASEYIKRQVDFTTRSTGGKGAFRELIDFILHAQDVYETVLNKMRKSVYNEKK